LYSSIFTEVTLGLTWFFGWDAQGVTVLGEVESGSFTVKWPFSWHELTSGKTNIRAVFSSAIVVAILGYFETMVGVKHLSMADNDVSKPNRELVALGAVNGVVCITYLGSG
jgi:MFS superfamily sulfate permease-like transporter